MNPHVPMFRFRLCPADVDELWALFRADLQAMKAASAPAEAAIARSLAAPVTLPE